MNETGATESDADDLTARAGYAVWAPFYDNDGNPLTDLEGPAVRERFGPIAGRRALDVGCGTGRHTAALIEAGAGFVVGLDLTPEMLAVARAKLDGKGVGWVRHALPSPLPFRDSTFDLAVLGLVAEHIEDLPRALAEVARVLTPGGRCVVSAPHPERTAEGQRTRFIDPISGLRRPIVTYHRTAADYHAAALAAGLSPVPGGELTLSAPAELADRLPRATPYVGRALGWVGVWSRLA